MSLRSRTVLDLGLAIVKKIIEEHDGVITIENKKGSGANINIQLPIKVNKLS